jgi:hypothetical protein
VARLCSATAETRNPTTMTPNMRAIRLNFTPSLQRSAFSQILRTFVP